MNLPLNSRVGGIRKNILSFQKKSGFSAGCANDCVATRYGLSGQVPARVGMGCGLYRVVTVSCYNQSYMVRGGIYYALGMLVVAAVLGWLTHSLILVLIPVL